MPIYEETLSDSVGVSRSVNRNYAWALSASGVIQFRLGSDPIAGIPAGVSATAVHLETLSASDSLSINASTVEKYFLVRTAQDLIRVSRTAATEVDYRPTLSDVVSLRSVLLKGIPLAALESVGVASSVSAAQALTVIEQLGLSQSILSPTKFGFTVAEFMQLRDSLEKFFSGDIFETINLDPTVVPTERSVAQATDSINITPSAERALILRFTAADTVNLDDVNLTQFFYSPALTDLIELSAAYISPDDVFTVWNINAATGAVSRYDNYAFNSFGNFGQMYLGTDENGLYELNGCNDEGSAIIARIRSGLAQLAESRFTALRDAYIGMRSDGSYVLRIYTGDGEVYNYAFDNQNMRSTRVQLGKGMRTRYFSFELISTGADFDLDSVEFIPITSTRRV